MHNNFRFINRIAVHSLASLLMLTACRPVVNTVNTTVVPGSGMYIIEHVNVVPMTKPDTVIADARVVIKDNRILSVNQALPAGKAITIDGSGKWLIPGLIDMHVHNLADFSFSDNYPTKGSTLFIDNQDFMLLYIANGVTTAFELSGRVEHFAQRNEIVKGKVLGPRIALAMLIEGGKTQGNVANTAEEGRQTVRLAKSQGYEFIKVYSGLNIETFKAIIDEAGKLGMKVVGHIPDAFRGKIEDAFVPHFDLVAHAEEYAKQSPDLSEADARRFATLAKKNNTWLMPTLITMERIEQQSRTLDSLPNLPGFAYVHPLLQSKWLHSNNYHTATGPERVAHFEKFNRFHILLVKAFKSAGVPIVAGTDAGTSGLIWGFSLPDELHSLVKAGLTNEEALAAATTNAANWLGIGDRIGTIEAGKLADLVLLDANPLIDIDNTRKIAGVFANGRWVDKKKIAEMLADLAKRNAANHDKYDWKKRKDY